MTESQIALFAGIAALIFVIVAFATRARTSRIAASLIGGVAAAALNIAWDIAAHRFGWWHYTFTSEPHGPILMYVPVALVFGAALGLVGWRIIRRLGATGAIVFFAAYVALGFTRDQTYAARGDVFVFEPGWQPLVADALGYLSLAVTVQLAMRLLVGHANADPLRS